MKASRRRRGQRSSRRRGAETERRANRGASKALCRFLPEHRNTRLCVPVALRHSNQQADPLDLLRLLRPRRERPRCCRAAECSQEFPPSDGDCHTPLPREVRKGNNTTPLACSLHVQGGQDAGCCHPASGSKAERHSFPLCPRKRTYLPILERIPPPALGERCHRLETPPLQVAAEERCCRASGASPTIDPLFRESYPENLRRKPTSRHGRKQMKTQTKTGLASILAIVLATAAASAQQAPSPPPTTPYG